MSTENPANEPTPEQVEAAARAALKVLMEQWPEEAQEGWPEEEVTEALELQRKAQRAALVAAQGAVPQAASEYVYCPIHGDLLAARRSFVCEHAKKGHEYGTPVMPSSGVDEDALAEVIRKLRFNDEGCRADGIDCNESVSDHADVIARAVAERLKGHGGESRDSTDAN